MVLLGLFAGATYLIYVAPTYQDPTPLMKFLFTTADEVYGALIFSLVLKKALEKAEKC